MVISTTSARRRGGGPDDDELIGGHAERAHRRWRRWSRKQTVARTAALLARTRAGHGDSSCQGRAHCRERSRVALPDDMAALLVGRSCWPRRGLMTTRGHEAWPRRGAARMSRKRCIHTHARTHAHTHTHTLSEASRRRRCYTWLRRVTREVHAVTLGKCFGGVEVWA